MYVACVSLTTVKGNDKKIDTLKDAVNYLSVA